MISIKIKKIGKKATIGATMTWIVATIIILVVIVLFVYASFVSAKQGGLFKPIQGIFPSYRYKLTSVSDEQMLLALLETKTGEMKIKNYLISEDYKELEKIVKPILDKFPRDHEGNWVFRVYEGDKKRLQVGKDSSMVGEINPSVVYFANKKVTLSFHVDDSWI
jgi:hypothetical protein